jgi:hypothetical protein
MDVRHLIAEESSEGSKSSLQRETESEEQTTKTFDVPVVPPQRRTSETTSFL